MNNQEMNTRLAEVFASDASDVEKLALAFEAISRRIVSDYAREVQVCQAMRDQENLVKERIKLGVMNSARTILNNCYREITGDFAWRDTPDES